MNAVCPQCNREFYKDEYWKRVCLDCFKFNKRKEREREYDEDRQYRYETHRPSESTSTELAIPSDILKKLMYLCHPDKHNNSRTATDMFVWLSALKK